jgi:hypothetical protein
MASVIFGLYGKTKVIKINIGISTLYIPLSSSDYSHRGKMTVVIVKYFCKRQKHIGATLELVSCHENSSKISAENAVIIARVCQNPGWMGGKKALKNAQKFIE